MDTLFLVQMFPCGKSNFLGASSMRCFCKCQWMAFRTEYNEFVSVSFQIYNRHHNDFNCATCTAHDTAVPFKKVTMVTTAKIPVIPVSVATVKCLLDISHHCLQKKKLHGLNFFTILAKPKVILWMMFWRTSGELSKVYSMHYFLSK